MSEVEVVGDGAGSGSSGVVPSYRALPWWRVPVPMSTKVVRYHPKITVHFRGGGFLYQ